MINLGMWVHLLSAYLHAHDEHTNSTSSSSSHQPAQVGGISSILEMKKPRLRDFKGRLGDRNCFHHFTVITQPIVSREKNLCGLPSKTPF